MNLAPVVGSRRARSHLGRREETAMDRPDGIVDFTPDPILVELPDAGHFIQEDGPDEIAAAYREAFAR